MKQLVALSLAIVASLPAASEVKDDPLAAYHADTELKYIPSTAVDVYRLWPAAHKLESGIPTLTVMRPHPGRGNGTAVVIAPGGAYVGLAGMLEGVEPAAWFTAHGVTAFILTYRVGAAARLPIPFADGARAMRFVRANAKAFDIDPGRIGMMGFSAGGHLAATTAVDATPGKPEAADAIERAGSRPDFLILAYPWLEGMQLRDDGTSQYCEFLLRSGARECRSQDYVGFRPLDHVTRDMPPTFLYHTTNDELVPVSGTVRFYQALVEHGVPAELHAFESGRHGSGLAGDRPLLSDWPKLMEQWLRGRGLLPGKP
jgi:acetyl esterase/lipase